MDEKNGMINKYRYINRISNILFKTGIGIIILMFTSILLLICFTDDVVHYFNSFNLLGVEVDIMYIFLILFGIMSFSYIILEYISLKIKCKIYFWNLKSFLNMKIFLNQDDFKYFLIRKIKQNYYFKRIKLVGVSIYTGFDFDEIENILRSNEIVIFTENIDDQKTNNKIKQLFGELSFYSRNFKKYDYDSFLLSKKYTKMKNFHLLVNDLNIIIKFLDILTDNEIKNPFNIDF